MSRLFIVLSLFFIALVAFQKQVAAVPAYQKPIEYRQPDGTTVTIRLKGDESVRWAETMDGYSLLRNKKGGWEYGTLDKNGGLVNSGVLAKEINQRSLSEISFLQNTKKKLTFSKSQVGILKQVSNLKSTQLKSGFPVSGSINLLMILMEFDDVKFSKTKTDFENLMYNSAGSFQDFYYENSYGQLTINVTVAGVYTAAENMAYYGTNAPSDDYRIEEFITEAVTFADDDVDFSDFDNDLDGKVDGVYVIYAGYGEEAGGGSTPDAIWAHASSISSLTLDGVKVGKYACSCELRGNDGSDITGIGVICHEFGHSLGAPDYYDTNYDDTGDGQYPGTDAWDVMAGGSWNNDGDTPAHHNPYTKSKIFNWATATIKSNVQTLTLRDITTYPDIIQIQTPTTNEYFLLENRQLNGFNAALPGHGMIIYHVDGDYIADHTSNNDINVGAHQGMYVVSAAATTETGVMEDGDINTDDCPWPGTGAVTTFDDTTTPNSKSWAGNNTEKAIIDITESGGNISFCLIVCDENVPADFTATASSSSQIDLAWNLNDNSDPVIVAYNTTNMFGTPVDGTSYSEGNSIAGGGTIIYEGSNAAFNHTALSSRTTYYYKEWSVLAGNNYSAGILANAKTLCGSSTLPFNETFDEETIPECWSQVDHQGNDQIWKFGITESFGDGVPNLTGGNYAYLNSDTYGDGNTQNADLITPTLDLRGFSTVNIQFNHFHQFWSSTAASATLSYSIDDGSTWTQIQKWTSSTTNPAAFLKDVPALDGQSLVKIKWNYTATYGGGWAIDDISITGTPVVTVPVDFDLTNETVGSGETVCYNAQNTITVAGGGTSVVFSDGSFETLIAGQSIRFLPGFHARQGSTVDAYITTTGSFCDDLPNGGIVAQTIDKSAEVIDISYIKESIDKEKQIVKIFPNPNNGRFTVALINIEGSSDISIFNTLGIIVYKNTLINAGFSEIELSYLPKGLYFVNVRNGKDVKTNKIIVQ